MSKRTIIKIENLDKTFHTRAGDVNALRGIDLDVREGEIFGIIGLSGAGKSTLVRCMNFLEVPTGGKVIFNDIDLSTLSDQELREARRSMGMIFQQFNLLMQKTALDNVAFPLTLAGTPKKEAQEEAKRLLNVVGLGDKLKAYPAQLSGGQKQRVAIARALATNPKVLLCDEATSALDPTTTQSILQLLKDINKEMNITIVIITHEMSVIEEICHRVAIIDKSGIAEIGNVSDVFVKPQSAIARQLVFSESVKSSNFSKKKGRLYRIIFDGRSSFEPVIANMILECKAPVNIMFADTKNIDGNAMGQMIIQLPEDQIIAGRMLHYLETNDIAHEEVKDNA